jgi:hypothetical protein
LNLSSGTCYTDWRSCDMSQHTEPIDRTISNRPRLLRSTSFPSTTVLITLPLELRTASINKHSTISYTYRSRTFHTRFFDSNKILQNMQESTIGVIVPVHSINAYRGNRGTAPLILNFGTRWSVVSLTFRPLYSQGKSPRFPLTRTLGRLYSRSGRCP